jgi:hypothetical protein
MLTPYLFVRPKYSKGEFPDKLTIAKVSVAKRIFTRPRAKRISTSCPRFQIKDQ